MSLINLFLERSPIFGRCLICYRLGNYHILLWILTKGKICQYFLKKLRYGVIDIFFSLRFSAKMNEKHSIMSPFDITSKLLGPYVFSATSRETLSEKMEYYFQDHSFMPLFIQVRLASLLAILIKTTFFITFRKIISRPNLLE